MTTSTQEPTTHPDLSAPPEGAVMLGEVDGIVFVQMPDGYIWMRGYKVWRLFVTGTQWPYTATYAAMERQQQSGR